MSWHSAPLSDKHGVGISEMEVGGLPNALVAFPCPVPIGAVEPARVDSLWERDMGSTYWPLIRLSQDLTMWTLPCWVWILC